MAEGRWTMDHLPSAISHQPSAIYTFLSRPADSKCQRPRLQRLTVGPLDAVDEVDLQGAEAFERLGELDLEHAVEGGELVREFGRRRRRLAALDALRVEIARLDVVLQRRRIQVA